MANAAARHESVGVVFIMGDTGRMFGLELRISSDRIPRSMEYAVETRSFEVGIIG